MCTVVCNWEPADPVPVRLLALRDELFSREFDLPEQWWPDQPGVVGGRDRTAGGTWCASDVTTGVTAVVLNRPEKMVADAGGPSRGVLPLLAVRELDAWAQHVDVAPMAGFNLVLATPDHLRWWSFDGTELLTEELPSGVSMFTPLGRWVDELDPRLASGDLERWRAVVRTAQPSPDPRQGMVVQRELEDGGSYETVFGQVIEARPGELRLDYLMHVARDPGGPWTSRRWTADDSSHQLTDRS